VNQLAVADAAKALCGTRRDSLPNAARPRGSSLARDGGSRHPYSRASTMSPGPQGPGSRACWIAAPLLAQNDRARSSASGCAKAGVELTGYEQSAGLGQAVASAATWTGTRMTAQTAIGAPDIGLDPLSDRQATPTSASAPGLTDQHDLTARTSPRRAENNGWATGAFSVRGRGRPGNRGTASHEHP